MQKLVVTTFAVIMACAALLVGSGVAHAEEYQCRGTVGAIWLDNIFVPDGATCTLNGTRAKGTIKVGTGATLRAYSVYVIGNIQGEGARSVNVSGSSYVGGNIQVKQGQAANISGARINGDLQFDENRGGVSATRNTVGGNLQAVKNFNGVYIANNWIREKLQCKENVPAPTGGGNVAGDKENQCAYL